MTFDIKTLSQEERTVFYRDAIRSAHAARSDAVRGMFRANVSRALAKRLPCHPLLRRPLIVSAVVLAMVIVLGVTASESLSNHTASVAPGHVSSGLPLLW